MIEINVIIWVYRVGFFFTMKDYTILYYMHFFNIYTCFYTHREKDVEDYGIRRTGRGYISYSIQFCII